MSTTLKVSDREIQALLAFHANILWQLYSDKTKNQSLIEATQERIEILIDLLNKEL